MTRLQLENGFIDLPIGTDFPFDLSFLEINKQGARTGGVSRTLEIDGTENNLTNLGLYFDIDLENDSFDRNKKTTCSLIQDGVEVFEGFVQLQKITRVNKNRSTNGKNIKLSIFIFDEVGNFYNEMGDKELTDLSFPELSHIFNRATIIDSWSNTSGYTYPQFAKDDAIYTLRDFKPAIFEYEYLKKIISSNGYTFEFDEFDSDSIRMDKRIIPFNGKQGDDLVGGHLKQAYTVKGEMLGDSYTIDEVGLPSYPNGYVPMLDYFPPSSINQYCTGAGSKLSLSSIFQDAYNQYNTGTDNFVNESGQGRVFQLLTKYDYNVEVQGLDAGLLPTAWEVDNIVGGSARCEIKICLVAQSTTNVNKVVLIDAQQVSLTLTGGETFASGYVPFASGNNNSFASIGVFDANEEFDIHTLVFARYYNVNGVQIGNDPNYLFLVGNLSPLEIPLLFKDGSGDLVRLTFKIDVSNLSVTAIPDITELMKGSPVNMNAFIPKKIKQRDLISSICKSYNLTIIPDTDNENNLIIKTRDKYYSDGEEWIWTNKFDESQPNDITFLSNEAKQKQVYKYKEDKDPLNTSYQSENLETYGQTTITLDNEYLSGTDERVLIYSATPSVGSGIGVPLPAINGVNPDCNIRVLLHNGVRNVGQYVFYDDLLPNVNEIGYTTESNNTSMFDDDITPNFSICYDAPNYLFHGYQQGQTTNYLYTLHYQQELTTVNTGKKLTAYFDLSEVDAQKLSKRLDWKIFIKDNGWFFISKVHGYNANKRTLTKVDLITADEKTRIKYKRPRIPFSGTTLNNSEVVIKHFKDVSMSTNIVLGQSNVSIDGKYNLVSAEKVKIIGDMNTVKSSDALVLGDRNIVEVSGVKVLANDSTPKENGVVISKPVRRYKALLTQASTNDPTAVYTIEDTINIESLTRVGVGSYEITATGKFPGGKVFVNVSPQKTSTTEVRCGRLNSNTIELKTYTSGILSDNCFTNTDTLSILIEVYP